MLKIIKKNNPKIRKWLTLFVLCFITLSSSACEKRKNVELPVIEDYDVTAGVEEVKNIRVGIISGPYGDMFEKAIQPSLVKMGYTVEIVYYENYDEPNFALANGEIDLNMFQNYEYLNSFKFEHNLHLSAITQIPTVGMGVYASSCESFEDLQDKATVAIPGDSTNHSRALMVLEAAGLVKIDTFVDKSKAKVDDLIENPKNLQFVSADAPALVELLTEYDLAVINGNYAISGGLELSEALYKEVLTDNYINVIAVRTEALCRQFVQDVIDVVHTEDFKNIITDADGEYSGFQRPRRFLDTKK